MFYAISRSRFFRRQEKSQAIGKIAVAESLYE
jgi:hypothetical protein